MIQLRICEALKKRLRSHHVSQFPRGFAYYVPVLILFTVTSLSLADDYYPANTGDIWLYDSKETGRTDYTQVVVIRRLPDRERRGALKNGVLQVINDFDTDKIREENRFTKDQNGLYLHKAVVHEGKLLVTVTYDAPVKLLKFPLEVGEAWNGTSRLKITVEGEYLQFGQATIQVDGEYVYSGEVHGEEIVFGVFETDRYKCRRAGCR